MTEFADASLPLQKAIVAAVKADANLNALIAGRIYDSVPSSAVMPYVSFGTFQVLPDQGDCYDSSDQSIQLDAWSAGPGSVECKKIGRALRACLDHKELPLDEQQRIVVLITEQTLYLRDQDGITQHGVLTFIARTEPIA